jgi:hypothetical protein
MGLRPWGRAHCTHSHWRGLEPSWRGLEPSWMGLLVVDWVVLGLDNLWVLQVMQDLLLIGLPILGQLLQDSLPMVHHPGFHILLHVDVHESLQLLIGEHLRWLDGLALHLGKLWLHHWGWNLHRLNVFDGLHHLDLLLDLIRLVLDKVELDGLSLWVRRWHVHGRELLLLNIMLLWSILLRYGLRLHVNWPLLEGLLVKHAVINGVRLVDVNIHSTSRWRRLGLQNIIQTGWGLILFRLEHLDWSSTPHVLLVQRNEVYLWLSSWTLLARGWRLAWRFACWLRGSGLWSWSLLHLNLNVVIHIFCVPIRYSIVLSIMNADPAIPVGGSSDHWSPWNVAKHMRLVLVAALLRQGLMQDCSSLDRQHPSSDSSTGLITSFDDLGLISGVLCILLHLLEHFRGDPLDIVLSHVLDDVLVLDQEVLCLLPCGLPLKQDVYWFHAQYDQLRRVIQALYLCHLHFRDFSGGLSG